MLHLNTSCIGSIATEIKNYDWANNAATTDTIYKPYPVLPSKYYDFNMKPIPLANAPQAVVARHQQQMAQISRKRGMYILPMFNNTYTYIYICMYSPIQVLYQTFFPFVFFL